MSVEKKVEMLADRKVAWMAASMADLLESPMVDSSVEYSADLSELPLAVL